MPEIIKVKLSQLNEVLTLAGFKALGVNAANESKIVDLGLIREGVDQIILDTDAAKTAANNAAASANQTNANVQAAEVLRVNAENVRVNAETARDAAETIRDNNETDRETAINELVSKGDYNDQLSYKKNNIVLYLDGCGYIAIQDAPAGTLPTDADYWKKLAEKGYTLSNRYNLFFDNSGFNGVDKTFDIPGTVVGYSNRIWMDRLRLIPGVDYTEANGQATFIKAPRGGSIIINDLVSDQDSISNEPITGILDGANKNFNTQHAFASGSLKLTWRRTTLIPGVDFNELGTTGYEFTNIAPVAADNVIIDYEKL